MESYLSFYDWLISLNITVPVFIRLPANVRASTLVKAKINWLRVCKFTLSTQKICSYILRVWLWGSDGTWANVIALQGGKKGGDAWLYGVDTLGKGKTKTNRSWRWAQSHWVPQRSLSQQSKFCSNYIPRLWARAHHIVDMLQTCVGWMNPEDW